MVIMYKIGLMDVGLSCPPPSFIAYANQESNPQRIDSLIRITLY